MSLPGKRPTAELLYENLTSILNSFDICALPRVMFAPVLLLFYCQKENTLTISIMVHKKVHAQSFHNFLFLCEAK